MANQQLYLSIGIPTFTVILALLIALFQNNRLAGKLDRVADRLADKIEATNSKIELKIESTNSKIEVTNREIASVRVEHHADFKMVMEQIVDLHKRVER